MRRDVRPLRELHSERGARVRAAPAARARRQLLRAAPLGAARGARRLLRAVRGGRVARDAAAALRAARLRAALRARARAVQPAGVCLFNRNNRIPCRN